jgi:glycosyltransferase involved in cell wall biosynthesis
LKTLLVLTPSHAVHGGVERIIESLARDLPASGWRVVVGLAHGTRFHDPEAYRRAFPALETVDLDGRSGTRTGRVLAIEGAIARVSPDVVLVARLFDGYEAVARSKLRGNALRLAVTLQAYEPEYVADLMTYAPFVDLCVTSGRVLARAAQHFAQLPSERVVSIPGGVRAPLRQVIHDDAQPLRLGYVGRLDVAQKRVLDLVPTLAELDRHAVPWTCRVAGAGSAETVLRQTLEQSGLARRVTFDGWCDLQQLYGSVYPELDVLLHFAAFEGITIAPREAMAHGVVPVISRFVGCVTEGQFLHERNALTFSVGVVAEAAAAVRRLHADRQLLRRLSAAAAQSQQAENSERGASEAWVTALNGVVERPVRCCTFVPRMPPPAGRLNRWGLPEPLAERLRAWSGRRVIHRDAGSEWPHWSGHAASERLDAIAAFATQLEERVEAAQDLGGRGTG